MPSETQQQAVRRHRRQTRLLIWLPFWLGLAVVVLAVGLAAAQPLRAQVSLMSDFMLTLLVLCPLAICLLPLYLGVVLLAWLVYRLHGMSERSLGRVVTWSETMPARATRIGDRLAGWAINLNARLAPLENKVYGLLDHQPEKDRYPDDFHKQ